MARDKAQVIREFGKALAGAQVARIDMGRLFLELTEIVGTKTQACDELNNAYPNAKDRLGYTLTVSRLNQYADIYQTFESGNGIRRGKHVITGEDVATLGLTPAKLQELANAVETNAVRVKDVMKQVRKAKAGQAENDAAKVTEAQETVLGMLEGTSEPTTLEEKIHALMSRRETIDKKIVKLNAERERVNREIAELKGETPEGEDEDEDGESVVIPPTSDGAALQAASA